MKSPDVVKKSTSSINERWRKSSWSRSGAKKKIGTIIGNSSVARRRWFDTFFYIEFEIVICATMFKVKKRVVGVGCWCMRKKRAFNRSHKYHQFKQVIWR